MMTKTYLYLYLAVLVTTNLVFAFIISVGADEQLDTPTSSEWKLPEPKKAVAVDIKQLTSSGFWGQVVQSGGPFASGEATQKEVDAQEAKKLRLQIKAIVNTKNTREVLMGTGKEYQRIQIGQALPGTSWILKEVGNDWLKLSKDSSPENVELLKLFSAKSLKNK